jgi:UDP-glucose 4-epimerase
MILVTGGAGYIGSHACIALLEAGHDVVVLDNLSNGHPGSVSRIGWITGRTPRLVVGDVRDRILVRKILAEGCSAVMHFAGLKAVGESVAHPASYYDANVTGACVLVSAMQVTGVRTLIFSSSATVYGAPVELPIPESHPIAPVNPYGRTKATVEALLSNVTSSDPSWRVAALRYFNPIGAHESGLIGEDPRGRPDNLLPFVLQTAVGRRRMVQVFGDNYDTPDGTAIRDYIHVMDLAHGHLRALDGIEPGFMTFNLGTGRGSSVLEVMEAVRDASGVDVKYRIAQRREGDVTALIADCRRAHRVLGWQAERNLLAACRDAWRWQSANPDGFGAATRLAC